MKDISVIIVAAGESKRMGKGIRKPYLMLKGKPVLRYSIDVFRGVPAVKEIIIAVNPRDTQRTENIIRRFKEIKTVVGGARRVDSVFNALMATDNQSRIILVHDAARPFVSRRDVLRLINEVRKSGAAILAVPVKDTIKRTEGLKNGRTKERESRIIKETITPRESLWAAQTPQGFRRDWLIRAYQDTGVNVTDDASLVEMMGLPVRIVLGSEANIKITTKADIKH
ncbi:MAG TPA: 2-C-methyl-D-erythritol 4-phosphate cytidylyltransferase [Planctomycetota bacterium]|nr:2-C-methyl-D-erythritol 4-phosphate cytidylyltransferase [Planctomycetota bacterium]